MKKLLNLLFGLCCLFVISAPNVLRADTPPSEPTDRLPAVFSEALNPAVFELPSGAMTIWRQFADIKPALLLMAAHPLLEPLPQDASGDLQQLISSGTDAELIRRGQFFTADPAFFPLQTISVAIASGLISELVVVLPLAVPPAQMSLEAIRNHLSSSGMLSTEESAALTLEAGVISGTARGIPLRLVHPDALPQLDRPLLIHLDLGYFKSLYINEVKTPAYRLLFTTAAKVRDKNYRPLAVSLSYSNQEIGLPLRARFLISNLADILRNPDLLSGNQPDSWKILSSYLNLNAMYMEGSARDEILKFADADISDPAVLLALATAQFQNKQSEAAFATLGKSVTLDPGYALEYLGLAEQGEKTGQWPKALELMELAAKAFPSDPFLLLHLAGMNLRMGCGQQAKPILEQLAKLPWSPRLHPDIPNQITQLMTAAQQESKHCFTEDIPEEQGK